MNNNMTILHSGKQYRKTKSYDVADPEIITSKVKLPYTFLMAETLWVEIVEDSICGCRVPFFMGGTSMKKRWAGEGHKVLEVTFNNGTRLAILCVSMISE